MAAVASELTFGLDLVEGIIVVTFTERNMVDEADIQRLSKHLMEIAQKNPTRLLLNFKKVVFLSSAFLGRLVTLRKMIDHNKGQLALCSITSEIQEVFDITKLSRIFRIFPDQGQAVKALRS